MDQREDLQTRVVARAARDSEFKALLLSDPHKAIGQELGIAVPSSVHIKVVEDTQETAHLVLPSNGHAPSKKDTHTMGVTWSAQSNGCQC
ncbi:MAG TPA: NHLP leader peptide family RiPP precursor [Actinocrinis sp.]|uniref:NHLP leader peptide family RiPP precursor n=1 Tax=Actinocrinis sp. TaxID=1920516 RepID=UPI002DDC9EBB|nr:NHLP leader peptide family RiPP precursor [Actinocrinis sp.]HEV2343862.1 NHLP leader peptide family RiPP precursor [Actinocrinis sp.]